MQGPAEQAARVDRAAQTMAAAGATLASADPGCTAFGAAAAGRLGETGRALHAQLARAIGARAREAATAGAQLAETARALRWVAAGYLEADGAARHRVSGRVPPAGGGAT